MKKLLFLFTTLLLISCSSDENEEQNLRDKLNNKVFKDNMSEQNVDNESLPIHIAFDNESDKLFTFFTTDIVDDEYCLDSLTDLTLNGFIDYYDYEEPYGELEPDLDPLYVRVIEETPSTLVIESDDGGTWLEDFYSLDVVWPYDYDELNDKLSFELAQDRLYFDWELIEKSSGDVKYKHSRIYIEVDYSVPTDFCDYDDEVEPIEVDDN
jgi:hypothetical protein